MVKFEEYVFSDYFGAFESCGKSWVVLPKRSFHGRRTFRIRAEVDYVNADEAKKLVEADGYAVVDVRDKSQFERAHIKSCYHAPLFIENQDNDPGTIVFYVFFYPYLFAVMMVIMLFC